jgi:hypothetical protein
MDRASNPHEQSSDRELSLDDHAIEAIARRVTQLLRQDPATVPQLQLVSAAAIAGRFGVSRQWVYENAARLGAVRLGRGARPRLRFDPQEVERRLAAVRERASPPTHRARDHAGWVDPADLIPIRRL